MKTKRSLLMSVIMLISVMRVLADDVTYSYHDVVILDPQSESLDLFRDADMIIQSWKIRSNNYVKVEVSCYDFITSQDPNDYFVHYIRAYMGSLTVESMDSHHVCIDSIRVSTNDGNGNIYDPSTTEQETISFPGGVSSYVHNFGDLISLAKVTVYYSFNHEYGTNGEAYYTCQHTNGNGKMCGHIDAARKTLYENLPSVNYIDADGNPQTAEHVVEINTDASSQVTWDSGWYVATGEASLWDGAICRGDVHLILSDGATLTAKGANSSFDDSPKSGIEVFGENNSLAIYGQEGQSGKLIATGGKHFAGIGGGDNESGSNITINGGIIQAYGGDHAAGIGGGSRGSGLNITINRGNVTAEGGNMAAGIGGGAYGNAINIQINGGTVQAEGGFDSSGDEIIIPGIGAGSGGSATGIYASASLLLLADSNEQPDTEIEHAPTDDIASALSDKKYVTLSLPTIALNKVPEQNVNYGTFYHKYADYIVPNEDATIYTVSVEKANNETCLVLHKIEDNVIPANTAVILRTDESSVIDLLPCADASGLPFPDNDLSGANLPMDAPDNCYILSLGQYGIGFYKYAIGNTLAAHTAYLKLNHDDQNTPSYTLNFDDSTVTGIKDISVSDATNGAIYDLLGHKVNATNVKSGIYIKGGKKIFIKE